MDSPPQLHHQIARPPPSDTLPLPSHSHASPAKTNVSNHINQSSSLNTVLVIARRNLSHFLQERLDCIERAKASLEEQFDFDALDNEERLKSKRNCEAAMRLGRSTIGSPNARQNGGLPSQVVVVKSSKAEEKKETEALTEAKGARGEDGGSRGFRRL